jgi:hypothetical protein
VLILQEQHAGMAELDLEMGASEWRKRGLPAAQANRRWGAPYHVQFRILFFRWEPLLFPFPFPLMQ